LFTTQEGMPVRNLLLLIVAAGAGIGGGVALAQTAPDGPRLAPEQFAILPWGETPGDPDALQSIYDCGFNLAGFVLPEYLDLVSDAQLKCIVLDRSAHAGEPPVWNEAQIRQHVESLVARIGQHKAVFGYYLNDEPGAPCYGELQAWVDSYRSIAPQALAYVNLFANFATPMQMGASTYAEYLESYVQTVQPAFLSYDHYALMADGTIRTGYFKNLELIRAAAQQHNIPFWNTVLSTAHFNYADPTAAGLRFQLYTTLAYGARGISYFTYFTPNIGNYRLGPIDQFGHKTATWDMLRNVNLQLHRIGPVYVTLRSLGVFHYPDVPAGCSGIETSRWISRLDGGNLMAGEFEGPDRQPFVLVVNKSLQQSAKLVVEFKEPGRIQFVSPYTGRMQALRGEHEWLAPGQGILLCLVK
jgi:hypothetical protein